MAIVRYGLEFDDGTSDLDIELYCYRHDDRAPGEDGRLTAFDHFRNAADLLFNWEGSPRQVIWNEWTDDMIREAISNKYLGLAGAGSSGKSDAMACFALVDWLSAPSETMFLVCSTTLAGARGRIWKSITELWTTMEARWKDQNLIPPGKMVQSKGRILGIDSQGNYSEACGIWLIAAGKDDEIEADKKLKGLKAPNGGTLRLIADEFSDLGMCVYTAMMGNLAGNPGFKGIGMANPGSRLTPFARFVEPEAGWKSLSIGMTRWKTRFGICLSFDATRSPRLTREDGERFFWMPDRLQIDQMAEAFGKDSVEYWAQIRGMFCPMGMERSVWSETELLPSMKPVDPTEWDSPPTKMAAALDPAFVVDGDRAPLMWAEFGTIGGVKVMNFLGMFIVAESGGKTVDGEGNEMDTTVAENMIDTCREHCESMSIPPKCFGFDCTGAGITFAQWMRTRWSQAVRAIDFAGAPAERRADSVEEHTIYKNRVTQLWVQPKALVRKGQIRGVPESVVEELVARRWHPKRHTGSKTAGACVEEKRDMKKRFGKSPDEADCLCILVEVAILNGFLDIEEIKRDDRRAMRSFSHLADKITNTRQKAMVIAPAVKHLPFRKRSIR